MWWWKEFLIATEFGDCVQISYLIVVFAFLASG